MNKLFLSLLVLGSLTYAKTGCVLVQSDKVDVTWKAFKTPKKIGVGGKFTQVDYTSPAKEGKNFRALLVGATVEIDTNSVNSGNAPRDAKLVKFFFSQLSNMHITGKITDIEADAHTKGAPYTGKLTVMINMNGKSVPTQMQYRYAEGKFEAHGSIDLAKFTALNALSSLTKACYELHKGKTWADVEIGFSTHIVATKCQVEK